MKKIFKKIFIFMILFSTFIWWAFASKFENNLLNNLWKDSDKREISLWTDEVKDFLINIADSLVNIFLAIAIIYFFIIIIKLIISENSEEESENFKKWFIWISIWFFVIQMAKIFVKTIYDDRINDTLNTWVTNIATFLLKNIITPFTNLLEMWASFFFLMIAIYAFYKLITSNWNDDTLKNTKNTIFYSIVWFVLVKVSYTLINAVYWECETTLLTVAKCDRKVELEWISWIISNIINWMNSFIWIWIVIILIYSWLQIIFSNWDEEKIKNWKKWLLFIVIWIWILIMNYLIINFFFNINK